MQQKIIQLISEWLLESGLEQMDKAVLADTLRSFTRSSTNDNFVKFRNSTMVLYTKEGYWGRPPSRVYAWLM